MTAALSCEVYIVVCIPAGKSLLGTERGEDARLGGLRNSEFFIALFRFDIVACCRGRC